MLDFQLLFGQDKLMHFIGFLGVSALVGIFILMISGSNDVKHKLKVVWYSLVTIGIIEEYRQFSDPGRSTEFLDALANIAGVSMGIGIVLGISFFMANKQRIFSSVFCLYPMILIMLLLGLIYLNEGPLFKIDMSFQERFKSLAALIGF